MTVPALIQPPEAAFAVVLTISQLETVMSSLHDLPYRVAAPIIDAIRAQVLQQVEHARASGKEG